MKILLKFILSQIFLATLVYSLDPITETPLSPWVIWAREKISPEIVNELKDFEHLIPQAKIDAIVAKHYVIDGNFRTALKYLRSNDFTLLQKQLLDIPEIISVLDFLHMTINATVFHQSNDNGEAAILDETAPSSSAAAALNDNGMDKISTNAVTTTDTRTVTKSASAALDARTRDVLAYKRPQLDAMEYADDVSGASDVAGGYNGATGNDVASVDRQRQQQPLVYIVLLDSPHRFNRLRAYHDQESNSITTGMEKDMAAGYRHRQQTSLGSFTTFVDEILDDLPRAEYQHMIIDKCKKNANFAEFYKALRSAEFKTVVAEAMVRKSL